jgi:predicted transcriptional regulator
MKRRSRTEIVVQILEAVNDHHEYGYGVTRTTIRKVFLSGVQLRKYPLSLTIHRLLSYDSTTGRYNIREDALQFLNTYYKMDGVVNQRQQQRQQAYHL